MISPIVAMKLSILAVCRCMDTRCKPKIRTNLCLRRYLGKYLKSYALLAGLPITRTRGVWMGWLEPHVDS